jgi:MbtH protein
MKESQAVSDEGEDRLYLVVVNDEEQYSIWPANLELPAGWHVCSDAQSKEGCLAYIDAVWTDMRPLSLRRAMGEP